MAVRAPVKATGGGGYSFEDRCAAFFILDLLAARPFFGAEFGPIVRVDFQVRELGWLFDDLLLTCLDTTGQTQIAVSVKSGSQIGRAHV